MSRRAKVIKEHSRFHGVPILVEQGGLPMSVSYWPISPTEHDVH